MARFLCFYVFFIGTVASVFAQADTNLIRSLNHASDVLSEKNTDSALVLAEKAYNLAVRVGDKPGKAEALNNIAVCFDIKGNSDAAIRNFMEAIRLLKELNDQNKLARSYSQMGICYFLQYQYDHALLYYGKAIDIYSRENSKNDLAGVLINQGIVYTYQGRFDDAEKNYLQALSIYKSTNTVSGLSPTYNSLGKIYYNGKDYKKAISYYLESEKYSLLSENEFNLIPTYNSLALCYKALRQFGRAKEYSEKSISISKKIGALEREMFCYETLAGIYSETGDYRNAYSTYKSYSDLKDTLFTRDKSESIAEMQAKFDVESNRQKVKEVELQKTIEADRHAKQSLVLVVVISVILIILALVLILLRNRSRISELLRQKNEAIQANLEQKELMMGEIHHRVKNNLQMVSSILDLQARELKDPESARALEDSLNRINAISLIHQRLYQTENIRGIKIDSYLKELCNDLVGNFSAKDKPGIQISYQIADLVLDLETAIPVGLITAELVINACKYAFGETERPVISLSLAQKDQTLVLSIADNGIGKAAYTSVGTSFGTKLIKSLSRKLRAEITENNDQGTAVTLTIHQFKSYES